MTMKEIAALLTVFAGIVANLMFQETLAAESATDWQLKQLHQPSPALLATEGRGRITIYDGVTITEIDRAMDTQFDRIGSMMFVRTRYPVDDGSYFEDSDCD